METDILMDMEFHGWTRTWHIMDGKGANWHCIMEMDMEYYGWKRSQLALYNGNGYGIHGWKRSQEQGCVTLLI